jgi:hypothetical protein
MLFLFNDVVFDLGDPRTTALGARADIAPEDLHRLSVGKSVKLVREMIFENQHVARTDPDKALFLAALIGWKTEDANALLAVCPEGARTPMDVQIRLASVSLVAIHQLRELQSMGRLSSHAVNMTVWSQAPERMRA